MHILVEQPDTRKTYNDVQIVSVITSIEHDGIRIMWVVDRKGKMMQILLNDRTTITIYANKSKQSIDKAA